MDDESKQQYNRDFRRARVVVENCIGMLKARWPVLLKGLRFLDMAKCSKAIEVFVALYNFILLEGNHEDNLDDSDASEINPPTAHVDSVEPSTSGKSKAKPSTSDKIRAAYYQKND